MKRDDYTFTNRTRQNSHPSRGERVVVVAHGGTIRACLAHLLPDLLGAWWRYRLDNARPTRVWAIDDHIRLLALNDTEHLPT